MVSKHFLQHNTYNILPLLSVIGYIKYYIQIHCQLQKAIFQHLKILHSNRTQSFHAESNKNTFIKMIILDFNLLIQFKNKEEYFKLLLFFKNMYKVNKVTSCSISHTTSNICCIKFIYVIVCNCILILKGKFFIAFHKKLAVNLLFAWKRKQTLIYQLFSIKKTRHFRR